MPLLGLDRVIVDILVVGDPVDGTFIAIGCGRVKSLFGSTSATSFIAPTLKVFRGLTPVAVRSRKSCSPSGASGAIAKVAVTWPSADRLEAGGRNPRLIEQDLLGVGQPLAGQGHRDLGAAPAADGLHAADGRAGRGHGAATTVNASKAGKISFMVRGWAEGKGVG